MFLGLEAIKQIANLIQGQRYGTWKCVIWMEMQKLIGKEENIRVELSLIHQLSLCSNTLMTKIFDKKVLTILRETL
jgi:hypothetical protein